MNKARVYLSNHLWNDFTSLNEDYGKQINNYLHFEINLRLCNLLDDILYDQLDTILYSKFADSLDE